MEGPIIILIVGLSNVMSYERMKTVSLWKLLLFPVSDKEQTVQLIKLASDHPPIIALYGATKFSDHLLNKILNIVSKVSVSRGTVSNVLKVA